MWTFSIESLSLLALGTIAILALAAWRIRIRLDRWAEAMIAAFPELLQLSQGEQRAEKQQAATPDSKTACTTAAPNGGLTHGMASHHFEGVAKTDASPASPRDARRQD